MMAVRAFISGLGLVIRAPILVVSVVVCTMVAAIPFGIVLGARLQEALAHQPPIALGSGEIDADWWVEFRAQADGLAATFTPAVIGFAATLDNLSSILDGTARPLALAGPVILAGLLWAWLWGGVLTRFQSGPLGLRKFVSAAFSHWARFATVSAAVAVVQLVLFLTVHAVLFGPIYHALSSSVALERNAFLIRLALYLIFGSLLMLAAVIADYTRVAIVAARPPTLGQAVAAGAGFARRHYRSVAGLFVITGLLFAGLVTVYGVGEIYGGAQVGGWRGVVIGQAYIVGRIAIRLTVAASELQLFKSLRG